MLGKGMKFLSGLLTLAFTLGMSSTQAAQRAPLPDDEVIAKLPADGGEEFNRLVFEHSPYLLQHARNPVDWRPWGEAAFAEAEKLKRPVLLSVGYATCHWCHVMEHESFEDEEVAKLINENFIAIKVDREERPDIDQVYMTVTQAMTGSGGWPMTVVMTPDKRPFFAGTYFPKNDRGGRPGFTTVLNQLHKIWTDEPEKIEDVASNIASGLAEMSGSNSGGALPKDIVAQATAQLATRYDEEFGGFGSSPKFPTPPVLSLLLRQYARSGDPATLAMVEKTLTAMHLGGIYDQVGFGLHRYSTDREWLVPHFEKMLYDQALLSIALLETYQVTQKKEYADNAQEIFTYVLRDMTSEKGGFFSAEDADSEGEEGTFYLWSYAEILEVLGDEDGKWFADTFQILPDGNFRDEATGKMPGTNIPHLKEVPEGETADRIEALRKTLYAHREKRIHPLKDDKVLTDWNGLMIAAFAQGYTVLGDEAYLAAAQSAADFALTTLRLPDGKLLKRARNDQAGLTAHLQDYAFLSWGLIELYQASFEPKYLKAALELTDYMLEHFWDKEEGGLFMTANDSEELLVRSKNIYGGAIPSGNAVAASNLLKLARLTGRTEFEERYDALVKAFSGDVVEQPSAFPQLLLAADFANGPSKEIVIAGTPGTPDTVAMLSALRKPFIPNKIVLFRPDDSPEAITALAEYAEEQKSLDGKATAYVCESFACKLPTNDPKKMLELIGAKK